MSRQFGQDGGEWPWDDAAISRFNECPYQKDMVPFWEKQVYSPVPRHQQLPGNGDKLRVVVEIEPEL